jgi:hypothetical protein
MIRNLRRMENKSRIERAMRLEFDHLKSIFVLFLLVLISAVTPISAATITATTSATNQVNFSPWAINGHLISGYSDPHPDTSVPQGLSGTEADSEFGRNVPTGFSQVDLLDATVTSSVPGFQSVLNRITSTPSGTSRLNQLQTQIYQNQATGGYTFRDNFGISSMTDSSGNYLASGTFVQTRQDLVSGVVYTTTCVGTFTSDPVKGYTLTSGTAEGTGSGCTTK